MSITAITVCKGRLEHLRATLPTLAQMGLERVILVDADCPEHCGAWVREHHASVHVERTASGTPFNLSAARNLGARAATSQWLLFVDADILLHHEFSEWAQASLVRNSFYRAAPVAGAPPAGTAGTVLVERNNFEAIGGYDDVIEGYGGEDDDLYVRLSMAGATPRSLPVGWGAAIEHGDAQRMQFYEGGDLATQRVVNATYVHLKTRLQRLLDRDETLSRPHREAIMGTAREAVRSQSPGKLHLRLPTKKVTRLRSISISLDITLDVS